MKLVPQQPNPNVKVKILLTGGHQYTVFLKLDNPLLHHLFRAVAVRSQKPNTELSGVFQIPLDEGRSTLYFPSHDLIGVVTEPGILLQFDESPQSSEILDSNYVQFEDFLNVQERNRLLEYVLKQESAFVSTSTSTGDTDYRQSLILHSFPEFAELMISRIGEVLPDVLQKLEISWFSPSQIETQLTAHNHGNFYKVHNDNGSPETQNRELTYVYYFYREPKPFSGGELVLYDSKIDNNYYVQADSFKTVEPRHNSIVFFPSRYLHEVKLVSCPSGAFADSRFTINGWIRR